MESEGICSFIPQIFIKHLLCIRHCPGLKSRAVNKTQTPVLMEHGRQYCSQTTLQRTFPKGLGRQETRQFFEQKGEVKGSVSYRLVRLELVAESR